MTRAINGDHWSIDVEYRGTVQNPVVSVNLPAISVHLSVSEMDAIASKWIAYRNKISEGIFAEPEDLGYSRSEPDGEIEFTHEHNLSQHLSEAPAPE